MGRRNKKTLLIRLAQIMVSPKVTTWIVGAAIESKLKKSRRTAELKALEAYISLVDLLRKAFVSVVIVFSMIALALASLLGLVFTLLLRAQLPDFIAMATIFGVGLVLSIGLVCVLCTEKFWLRLMRVQHLVEGFSRRNS